MKKSVKVLSLAAALAVMIPVSAYAATAANEGTRPAEKSEVSAEAAAGKGHFGKGIHGADNALSSSVLDLLKLDEDALKEKLDDGKTLAQMAEEQGVSREALKQALIDANAAKLDLLKERFAANVDELLDAEGHAFMHKGFRDAAKGMGRLGLAEAAAVLGLDETELETFLKSGKTLAEAAEAQGVDVQKLMDAQKAVLAERVKQAVADGKLTQEQADEQLEKASEMAEKIVDGTWDRHSGKGPRH